MAEPKTRQFSFFVTDDALAKAYREAAVTGRKIDFDVFGDRFPVNILSVSPHEHGHHLVIVSAPEAATRYFSDTSDSKGFSIGFTIRELILNAEPAVPHD